MVSRAGAFGILMAAVGTLFLVPAHGSAQDSLSVSCAAVNLRSPLEDLLPCVEQGFAQAQYSLGIKYFGGESVPKDEAEAVHWFRMAAEQGHAAAQMALAAMYVRGEGVPEDLVLANMWISLSAAQRYDDAQINKEIMETMMTREQIAEAQRLSREWIETHPEDGGN